MSMSSVPAPVTPALNVPLISLAFTVLVAIIGGALAYGEQGQRIRVIDERTQPLAQGDLVRVQTDVAWIRERLEKSEAAR